MTGNRPTVELDRIMAAVADPGQFVAGYGSDYPSLLHWQRAAVEAVMTQASPAEQPVSEMVEPAVEHLTQLAGSMESVSRHYRTAQACHEDAKAIRTVLALLTSLSAQLKAIKAIADNIALDPYVRVADIRQTLSQGASSDVG